MIKPELDNPGKNGSKNGESHSINREVSQSADLSLLHKNYYSLAVSNDSTKPSGYDGYKSIKLHPLVRNYGPENGRSEGGGKSWLAGPITPSPLSVSPATHSHQIVPSPFEASNLAGPPTTLETWPTGASGGPLSPGNHTLSALVNCIYQHARSHYYNNLHNYNTISHFNQLVIHHVNKFPYQIVSQSISTPASQNWLPKNLSKSGHQYSQLQATQIDPGGEINFLRPGSYSILVISSQPAKKPRVDSDFFTPNASVDEDNRGSISNSNIDSSSRSNSSDSSVYSPPLEAVNSITTISSIIMSSPNENNSIDVPTRILANMSASSGATHAHNLSSTSITTHPDSASTFPWDVTVRQWAIAVVLSIIPLTTIIGNVMVVYAINTEKALQQVQNNLLVSLATADLLVAIIVMPIAIALEITSTYIVDDYRFGKKIHLILDRKSKENNPRYFIS